MRGNGDAEKTGLIRPKLRELKLRRFCLRIVEGPDLGRTESSTGAEFAIGTATGNQFVLRDQTVSRHHCQITPGEKGFRLRDLDSTNGTFVDGLRIEAAFLKTSCLIRVGFTTCQFEVLDETVREPLSDDERFDDVLGASAAMRRIFALLPRIAASDATLLVLGETGTGKGLLARAVHRASPRASGPFVSVDCSSLPPTLVESELLGHERGSFTGAHGVHHGVFEAAAGGTVFLDEIGELPLDMQPKLLRALEERTIRRVGGTAQIDLDVRVVAATNRDLRLGVNQGTFRADLYYRLNTLLVVLPPLRDRRDDIPLLAAGFYKHFVGAASPPLDPAVIESLSRRDWPGNVRELRSWIERAALFGAEERGTLLGDEDASLAGAAQVPGRDDSAEPSSEGGADTTEASLSFRAAKEIATARWERRFLAQLIGQAGGNLSRAARQGRMDRNHLRDLLRRHRLPITGE